MNPNTDWCFHASILEMVNCFNHCSRSRNNVIYQNRCIVSIIFNLGNSNFYIPISKSCLFKNNKRAAGLFSHLRYPLFAFCIRPY